MLEQIITTSNFSTQLAICMEAASIGSTAIGMADGQIEFGRTGADAEEPAEIVALFAEDVPADLRAMVAKGSAETRFVKHEHFLDRAREFQRITVEIMRGAGDKNFRREAEAGLSAVKLLAREPVGNASPQDARLAAMAFLESALLFSRLRRPDDRIEAKGLFHASSRWWEVAGERTFKAITLELAAGAIDGIYELTPQRNKIRGKSAAAWLGTLNEYDDPSSVRFRVYRALVYTESVEARETRLGLFQALAGRDFDDGDFYGFCTNSLRYARELTDVASMKAYEWRPVKEALDNAAYIWPGLDEAKLNITEQLMHLSNAAEKFASGGTEYIIRSN